ncbi:MAG TPA: hypothetical protein VMN58_07755 [Acidimicrobiales bacterium]|nr:hypothetical protein [Acidimicrobiales bacterium]
MSLFDLRFEDPLADRALLAAEEEAREALMRLATPARPRPYCWGVFVRHGDDGGDCLRGSACTGADHLAETACAVFTRCPRCGPTA